MRQKTILPYKLNVEICQLLDDWRSAVSYGDTFRSFGDWVGLVYNEVCIEHWQRAVADWAKVDISSSANTVWEWKSPGTYSDWLNNMAEDSTCECYAHLR